MDKKMKKYLKNVERRLNLPRDIKKRVISDLESDIIARKEAGLPEDVILAELGTAKKAANDLNQQMKEFAYRKSPWRFVFAALAAYGAAELLDKLWGKIFSWYILNHYGGFAGTEAESIGIIGGADGPTAIFVTTAVDSVYYWWIPMLLIGVGVWGFLRLRKCKQK